MNKEYFRSWVLICVVLGAFMVMGQTCRLCTDEDGDGYAVEGGFCGEADCDDTDPDVNPGVDEVCDDGIDNNCDGEIDEECEEPADLSYVGSDTCKGCHNEIHSDFINSGHPYKFNLIDQTPPAAPTYPSFVVNYMELPYDDITWADISGVIGGFGWKARFVDLTGVIVGTASSIVHPGEGHNQLNHFELFEDAPTWSDYDKDTVDKEYSYSCFVCHTTGAEQAGEDVEDPDKNWLEEYIGVDSDRDLGFFAFGGVQCEACHGKGSAHAASPSTSNITHPEDEDINDLCGSCHFRDPEHNVLAKGDFVQHHEQYDEFIHTEHYLSADMNCATCHDPHKRVIWSGSGITTDCESCHASVALASPHDGVECITCHMAYIAKSSQETGYLKGDVRSHTFAISTDPDYKMIVEENGAEIMQVDSAGLTHIGLSYACYQCHNNAEGQGGGGSAQTLQDLSTYAATIHGS